MKAKRRRSQHKRYSTQATGRGEFSFCRRTRISCTSTLSKVFSVSMSERKSMLRHRARAAQNRIQWSVLSWNLLCIFFCHLITEANNNRIISLNQLNCYVIGRLGMTSDRVHKAHSASRASGHRCF